MRDFLRGCCLVVFVRPSVVEKFTAEDRDESKVQGLFIMFGTIGYIKLICSVMNSENMGGKVKKI